MRYKQLIHNDYDFFIIHLTFRKAFQFKLPDLCLKGKLLCYALATRAHYTFSHARHLGRGTISSRTAMNCYNTILLKMRFFFKLDFYFLSKSD